MNKLQADICLIAVTLCWSCEVILHFIIPEGVNPFATVCVTSLLGAIILWAYFGEKIKDGFRKDGALLIRRVLFLSLLNIAYNVLFVVGLESFDVPTGAFTASMTVVILPVVLLVMRRDVMPRTWVSALCILTGVLLVALPTFAEENAQGHAVMVIGCLLRSVYIIKPCRAFLNGARYLRDKKSCVVKAIMCAEDTIQYRIRALCAYSRMGHGMDGIRFLLDRKASSACCATVLVLLLICSISLSACMSLGHTIEGVSNASSTVSSSHEIATVESTGSATDLANEEREKRKIAQSFLKVLSEDATSTINAHGLPSYDGNPSAELNGDVPYFDVRDAIPFGCEHYPRLDVLGRCRTVCAIVGVETMPAQKRSTIGDIKPSGWRISKYEWIDGKYLFNRCHLIGYQLTGQNANERNLITGTRYLNVEGMQPFENSMADYVRRTGNHVLYRVTPVFEGTELVARGVVLEAYSIEDDGSGIQFCRWCPNVQPGVVIDYSNGKNRLDEEHPMVSTSQWEDVPVSGQEARLPADAGPVEEQDDNGEPAGELAIIAEAQATEDFDPNAEYDYILNKSSHLVHRPDCPKVVDMKTKNKRGFNGSREEVLALAESEDYRLCRYCNP